MRNMEILRLKHTAVALTCVRDGLAERIQIPWDMDVSVLAPHQTGNHEQK